MNINTNVFKENLENDFMEYTATESSGDSSYEKDLGISTKFIPSLIELKGEFLKVLLKT